MTNKKLDSLCQLSSLPSLHALRLGLSFHEKHSTKIYSKIFLFPHLKYVKVSCDTILEDDTNLSWSSDEKLKSYSPIERLIIDHDCTLNLLHACLSSTARLQRLICKKKLIESTSVINSSHKPSYQFALTHICIHECFIEFKKLISFIKGISPQLQVLRLITVNHFSYFYVKIWEKLICNFMPKLSRLEMTYKTTLDKINGRSVVQFPSPIWMQRRFVLQYHLALGGLKRGTITYSLSPYKRYRINGFSYTNMHTTNQLTITYWTSSKSVRSIILEIKPILSQLSVTRLIFTDHGHSVSIDFLHRLLQILTHVNLLKIPSLIPKEIIKGVRIPMNISRNSQITQVYIKRMNSIHDMDFLLRLCPQMNFFETDQISRQLFQDFLKFKSIQQLTQHRIFSFRNFQIDDQIIKQLRKTNFSYTHSLNNLRLEYKNKVG